ncbi:MAG: hypothetical protein PVI26_00355 [Chitinispirillia bacterium]|jgi:hypothetical protein
MPESFSPVKEVLLYCRFCNKVVLSQLERSIAGSGRVVDRESTFEYICSRCHRTHCYYGKDIMESTNQEEENISSEVTQKPRNYNISEHFLIGETINHPSYKSIGIIVGKEPGKPNRLLVKFEKTLTSLVEDIN